MAEDLASVRARIVRIAEDHGMRCAARVARVATERDEWLDVGIDLFMGSVHVSKDAKRVLGPAAQAAQCVAFGQVELAAQVLAMEGV